MVANARRPYGHDGIELIADIYLLQGHNAVRQDFRGTGDSGGNFTIWHKAANDTYDTISWLVNGVEGPLGKFWSYQVGEVGASADGLASYASLREPHALMYATFNIFAASRGYPIIFPQGGSRQSLADLWISSTLPNKTEAAIGMCWSVQGCGRRSTLARNLPLCWDAGASACSGMVSVFLGLA